jgi:hypothetical protein
VQRVKYVKLIPNNITTDVLNHDNNNADGFTLYPPSPNPSDDNNLEINYTVSEPGIIKLDIINTLGAVVAELINKNITTADVQTVILDTHTLAPGIYYVRMRSNNKQLLKKFILTK